MGRRGLTCWSCKRPVLVKDIGEERRRFPGGEMEYLCRDCQRQRAQALIDKTREELGLPVRNPSPAN